MDQMFNECTSLESVNFLNLQGQKLQTIDKLFNGCSSLKNVDLVNFQANEPSSPSKVTA